MKHSVGTGCDSEMVETRISRILMLTAETYFKITTFAHISVHRNNMFNS